MNPIATTSAAVNNYIESMKQALSSTDYGKVGIIFTIDHNQVCYVQQIREKRYALQKTVDMNGDIV